MSQFIAVARQRKIAFVKFHRTIKVLQRAKHVGMALPKRFGHVAGVGEDAAVPDMHDGNDGAASARKDAAMKKGGRLATPAVRIFPNLRRT